MIDAEGFRPNVGIILASSSGRVLWARRVGGQNAWQFPQGGVQSDESIEAALYRELKEEIGLEPRNVEILACTRRWLRYRLPKQFVRHQSKPTCIGQKQKWYLLKLLSADSSIVLDSSDKAEFDQWCWVSYWYPLNKVINFKRNVYRRALKELSAPFSRFQQHCALEIDRDTQSAAENRQNQGRRRESGGRSGQEDQGAASVSRV